MKNCFLCFENASTQDKKREGILFNFAQEGILYSGQDSKNDANRIGLVLELDNGKLPKEYYFGLSELSRINRS
jgi:hypothetical protein